MILRSAIVSVIVVLLSIPVMAADNSQSDETKVDYRYAVVLDEGMNSGKLYLPDVGSRVSLTVIPLFFYDMPANSVKFVNSIQGKALSEGEDAPWPASGWSDFDEDSVKVELIADGRAAVVEFTVPSRTTTVNIGWFYHHWNEVTYRHRSSQKVTSLSISPNVPFADFVASFRLQHAPTVTPETQ